MWSGDEATRADYERLLNNLLAHHVQFHIVDAAAISNAQTVNGGLDIGFVRYETLLIPDEAEQSPSIAAVHSKALDAGLTVLAATDWRELALRNPLQIRDKNGADLPEVWTLWRETETQQLLFFADTSGDQISANVAVKTAVASWEIWSLESGEVAPLSSDFADGTNRFALDLSPYGSALLVATRASESLIASATNASATAARRLPLDGEWQLQLDRPNALRLNRWQASVANDDGTAPALDDANWREIEALPLRYLDARGGGWTELLERHAGETVWYRRRINCEFVPQNLEILIENGAIAGDWSLLVNGTLVPSSAFAPRDYNGADKTAAPLAALFQTGENVLSLKVENAPPMGGLVTPLHLIGDFALGSDATPNGARRTLIALPATARFGELVAAGLPHFSGAATYRKALDWGDARTVELPADFGEIAELRVAGASLSVRAWSPYRWDLAPTKGPVETEIVVTNTLLPFIEGQQWDSRLGVAHGV